MGPPGEFLCPARHRITIAGHLDRQVAGVQAPPGRVGGGVAYLSPPDPGSQTGREKEECEANGEGESPDGVRRIHLTELDYWGNSGDELYVRKGEKAEIRLLTEKLDLF